MGTWLQSGIIKKQLIICDKVWAIGVCFDSSLLCNAALQNPCVLMNKLQKLWKWLWLRPFSGNLSHPGTLDSRYIFSDRLKKWSQFCRFCASTASTKTVWSVSWQHWSQILGVSIFLVTLHALRFKRIQGDVCSKASTLDSCRLSPDVMASTAVKKISYNY